ncbi:hypothetical protein FJT64_016983 [Amphibalanus amphitrite]|uniref:F-actin binding domain-containing protein n=1 Tax=Amphibalanus amphitrite TaxID=1232801 RepID=A0A6A4WYR7_AMPAM|nr:hypothetical protein FJT64_016983 [Amphibalanus amphitrite]
MICSLRDSSYTEEVAEDSEGVAGAAAAQTELTALRAVKTPSWRRPLQRSRCRRYRPLLMTRAGVPDDEQDERQVAPLEEHHVNESFMRYGTLPKGAHIGAFLDSLRESGLRGSAEGGEAAAGAAGEARALRSHTEAEGVRPPASAAAAKKPSAMVRSNSSNTLSWSRRFSRNSARIVPRASRPQRRRHPTSAPPIGCSRSAGAGSSAEAVRDLAAAVERSQGALETSSASSVACMQVSDKLGLLLTACGAHAGQVPPTGWLRFRALQRRLETHAGTLRSAGGRATAATPSGSYPN